jgi:hypothetical protein
MLSVDNFGVKYVDKKHVDHLIWCIKQKYQLTEDWTGDLYLESSSIGITMPILWTYPCRIISKSSYRNINIACPPSHNTARTHLPQSNTEPKHKPRFHSISRQHYPPTRPKNPTCHWQHIILCPRRRHHCPHGFEFHCHRTIQRHYKYNVKIKATS